MKKQEKTIRAVQNRQLRRYTYMEKRAAQLQVLQILIIFLCSLSFSLGSWIICFSLPSFCFPFLFGSDQGFFFFPSISLMKLAIKILVFVCFLQHPVSNTLHPRTPLLLSRGPSVWTQCLDEANNLPNWFSPSLLQSNEA